VQQEKSTLSIVKRLFRFYLKPYWGQIAVAFVFMAVAAAMTALFAKLIEPLLDEIFTAKKQHMILPLAGFAFSCFFIRGVSSYVHTILMNSMGQRIVSSIQNDLMANFMTLDLSFFHAHPSGDLVSRMVNDVNIIRSSVISSFTGIGMNLLTLIFLIFVMVHQDWVLSLIALVVLPFGSIFVVYIGKRLRKISKVIQLEMGLLSNVLIQTFQGIRQVKAYNAEEFEKGRIYDYIDRLKYQIIKSIRIATLSTPLNETLLGVAFAGLIVYGGFKVIDGNLTTGALMSFIAAFSLAYEPMKKLAKLNNTLQMGLGAADRVFEFMDKQANVVDYPDAEELKAKTLPITFDKVTFKYGAADYALEEMSFKAPSKKVTALVGPSGGGKSTVLNMILRFYDVDSGKVMIGKQDITALTIKSLRDHISLVSQDVTIFDDTVKANIAYGLHDVSQKEIEKAAKAAAAHEFITELEQGYDTRLGENGVSLSGGQRQRLSIARALLRNTRILLLDEATSALDSESEKAIQDAMNHIQKGRTVIVIAHRLSTIQNADHIVVIDKGRVVEEGTHKSLMAQHGLYERMVYTNGYQ
jgi:subfamily B ATP-binding cassette protein MsbA